MLRNEWDQFFKEKALKIFNEKKTIIDVGGTLGLRPDKSNRRKPETDFLQPLLRNVEYKVLDLVPDYHPDLVGDIQNLPLPDNSVDAIFCCSILEHVENPFKGMEEIYRVLKPGGYAFIYAPFLYYYHPMEGYYKDFYRFTYDGWEYLTRKFTTREISRVHGPIATLFNLIPFFSKHVPWIAKKIDAARFSKSRQVSGYNVFCVK